MHPKYQKHLSIGFLMALWLSLWACTPAVPSQQSCAQDADCTKGYACVFGACTTTTSGHETTTQISDANTNQPDIPTDPPCLDSTTRSCFPSNQTGCTLLQGSYSCTAPCNTGTQTCSNGMWGACIGAVVGKPEECNGQDDDCDGQIDNNLTLPPCAKQDGVCQGSKKQVCDGKNGWKECTQTEYTQHSPAYETSETQCDGLDNDCDGKTDNNLPPNPCTKQHGVCNGTQQTCKDGKWEDCNDQTYLTHNAAYRPTESPTDNCDGIDNNCDGKIDEGCSCVDGNTQPCFPGNIGCQKAPDDGVYKCNGLCKIGTQVCSGGMWGPCTGAVIEKPEECNGQDDDCDGLIDNNLTPPLCSKQDGVCNGAKQTCDGGKWKDCDADAYLKHNAAYETNETKCDGLDNDCNGKTDNDLQAPLCKKQDGVCKGAKQTCNGINGWKDCTHPDYTAHAAQTPNNPPYEINETLCDGFDNDCDGAPDNNLTAPLCSKQHGVCNGAKRTCDGKNGWKDCDDNAYTSHNPDYEKTESKCDGKDNDCDGTPDKHCDCIDKQTRPCFGGANGCKKDPSTGIYTCSAPCQTGTQECVGGKWAECKGDVREAPETCDGIDNDCDGQIDNNLKPPPCDKQDGVCQGSTKSCDSQQKKWLDCDNNRYKAHSNAYESTETKCDGLDNNCDGKIDNDLPPKPCTKQDGVCNGANQTCESGQWKDCRDAAYYRHNNDYQPTETKCDGKDNDCDGKIDENIKRYNYPTNTVGCTLDQNTQTYTCVGSCMAKEETCNNGGWFETQKAVTPQKEYMTCTDGKDNDCDGKTDYNDIRSVHAASTDERDNCVSTDNLIQNTPTGQKEGQVLIKDIVSNASNGRGDIYLLGEVKGTYRYTTVDGQTASIPNFGRTVGLLMKVTPEYRVHWAFTFATNALGSAFPQRLAYTNNRLYITGYFQGTISLPKGDLSSSTTPPQTLTAGITGKSAAFVWAIQDLASQQPTGLWADKIDYGDTTAHTIVANGTSVYVGGKSVPSLLPGLFGSGNDPFITHLSSLDGSEQGKVFIKTVASSGADNNDRIWQLALFNNDLIATGTFSGAYEVDTNNKIYAAGGRDAFLMRLSLDLKTIRWFKRIHSADNDTPTALYTQNDDIYVAGTTFLNGSNYKLTLESANSGASYGFKSSKRSGFIARYENTGFGQPTLKWAYMITSPQNTSEVVPTALGMRDGFVHLVGSQLGGLALYNTSPNYNGQLPTPIPNSTLAGSATQISLFLLLLGTAGDLVSPVEYPSFTARAATNPMALHDPNATNAQWLVTALAFDLYGMDYMSIGFAYTTTTLFELNPIVWSNLSLRDANPPATIYQKGAFPRKTRPSPLPSP